MQYCICIWITAYFDVFLFAFVSIYQTESCRVLACQIRNVPSAIPAANSSVISKSARGFESFDASQACKLGFNTFKCVKRRDLERWDKNVQTEIRNNTPGFAKRVGCVCVCVTTRRKIFLILKEANIQFIFPLLAQRCAPKRRFLR